MAVKANFEKTFPSFYSPRSINIQAMSQILDSNYDILSNQTNLLSSCISFRPKQLI